LGKDDAFALIGSKEIGGGVAGAGYFAGDGWGAGVVSGAEDVLEDAGSPVEIVTFVMPTLPISSSVSLIFW